MVRFGYSDRFKRKLLGRLSTSTVFRRLYRVEKSRTSFGTGLGLSLVKAIADLHGASVRLENAILEIITKVS